MGSSKDGSTWQKVLAQCSEDDVDNVCGEFALHGNDRFDFEELIVSDRLGAVASAFSSPN